MAITIPANVSPLRAKLAQAAARRKLNLPVKKEEQPIPKPGDRKAGQEAAEARRKAREALQSAAEKDVRMKELEERLAAAEKRAEDSEPLAKKWSDFDHKRKERLIAKFPKEEQGRIRKFDADAIELLAEARGFAEGAQGKGADGKPVAGKILSLDDANAAAKSDPAAYNKWVDEVAAGTIKLDSAGKVIA